MVSGQGPWSFKEVRIQKVEKGCRGFVERRQERRGCSNPCRGSKAIWVPLLMPGRKTQEAKDKANKELDKEVKEHYEARGREDT